MTTDFSLFIRMAIVMRGILLCTAIIVAELFIGGCSHPKTFRVYKNGSSFYVTDNSLKLRQVLCDSGDIDSIVKDSELPDLLQHELKDGICTSGKVKKSLFDTLNGLTREQNLALKDAFRRSGYEINKVADACAGGP